MKVLITAGGTAEPIDGVRRIINSSTGATGGVIAGAFASHGVDVVLLHAASAPLSGIDVDRETFVTFGDLETALKQRLGQESFDAIIHLAAVSDYSVAAVEIDGRTSTFGHGGKIGSGRKVSIHLEPNPKLLDHLRSWSRNASIQIIAFKLTHEPDSGERSKKVRALLDRGTSDLVVHNDLAEITDDRHPAEIWTRKGPIVRATTKTELAEALLGLLESRLDNDQERPEG